MHNTETIQLLRDTKERLFEKGWMKNDFGFLDGPNCLAGAVLAVASDDNSNQVFTALEKEIGNVISGWNDAPERTFNDVVDVIDSCIKRLELE